MRWLALGLFFLLASSYPHFMLLFQIYEDSLGKAAEAFGPLSKNVEMRLRALDKSIQNFLVRLREVRMDQIVSESFLSSFLFHIALGFLDVTERIRS